MSVLSYCRPALRPTWHSWRKADPSTSIICEWCFHVTSDVCVSVCVAKLCWTVGVNSYVAVATLGACQNQKKALPALACRSASLSRTTTSRFALLFNLSNSCFSISFFFLLCLSGYSSLLFSNLLLLDGVLFLELQALNLFLITAGSVSNCRFYRLCIYFLSCSSFCVFLHLSLCLLAINLCIHNLHNPTLRPSHAFVNWSWTQISQFFQSVQRFGNPTLNLTLPLLNSLRAWRKQSLACETMHSKVTCFLLIHERFGPELQLHVLFLFLRFLFLSVYFWSESCM